MRKTIIGLILSLICLTFFNFQHRIENEYIEYTTATENNESFRITIKPGVIKKEYKDLRFGKLILGSFLKNEVLTLSDGQKPTNWKRN
jgi:hypothetical protein